MSNQLEGKIREIARHEFIGLYMKGKDGEFAPVEDKFDVLKESLVQELLTLFDKYASEREKEARIDEVNRVPVLGVIGSDGKRTDTNQLWKVDRLAKLKEGKE